MEDTSAGGKETDHKLKNRLKGKLFGKDKKATNNEGISNFLHGSTDRFQDGAANPTPDSLPNPPQLSRINTARLDSTPPDVAIVSSQAQNKTEKRSAGKKGLAVRFTDGSPEIIGEGGDEAEAPTAQIGNRKRANSHSIEKPPYRERTTTDPPRDARPPDNGWRQNYRDGGADPEDFQPKPFRRVQTGLESAPGSRNGSIQIEPSQRFEAPLLPHINSNSFSARAEVKMRADEGLALSNATSRRANSLLLDNDAAAGISSQMDEVDLNTTKNSFGTSSPTMRSPNLSVQIPSQPTNYSQEQQPRFLNDINVPTPDEYRRPSASYTATSTPATSTPQSTITPGTDDALKEFSNRMSHLFTLFQLSAESVKAIPKCSLDDFVRAALWWFLKGRMNLETTIRERPTDIASQQTQYGARQQAYADLAKSLWIIEHITPRCPEILRPPSLDDSGTKTTDVLELRTSIITSLRKLTGSMERNNILPPPSEDAPLVQGLDCAIWTPEEGNKSLALSQKQTSLITLADSFPMGDTKEAFHYGRVFADAVLTEEDDSQRYKCPVLVTLLRGRDEMALALMVANQEGTLKIRIGDRARGPMWEDVKWLSTARTLDVKMPRGFRMQIQCKEADFKTLWAIYDYETRIYSALVPRRDEEVIFEATARSFQYFDSNPQSQKFPKEPQGKCQLRVFETILVEAIATGVRKVHRGFRVGLITSPKVKNVRGLNYDLPSSIPVQFNFLRGEDRAPALLLKVEGVKGQCTMVFTFEGERERTELHAQLTSAAIGDLEAVVASTPLSALTMASLSGDTGKFKSLEALECQNIRIINEVPEDVPVTNLANNSHLRVFAEFKTGSLTDRVNIGPGELRLRLEVRNPNELKVLRLSQQDMTIAVIESQVSKQFPDEVRELLEATAAAETIRIFTFPSQKELHLIQAALTGFRVRFDGIASSFSIARRRMVVPIYKKWDAAITRIQLVEKEKVVQLVAFFENYNHGDCLNFTLKSTDFFEGTSKSNKHSVRIVDAKFALPKPRGEGEASTAAGFVCLDMPEYPGEHDDITIAFDNERGTFASLKQLHLY